jgi:hypothetical protein
MPRGIPTSGQIPEGRTFFDHFLVRAGIHMEQMPSASRLRLERFCTEGLTVVKSEIGICDGLAASSPPMRITGYEFEHICEVEPARDIDGSVRRFMPQDRYQNTRNPPLTSYWRRSVLQIQNSEPLSGQRSLCSYYSPRSAIRGRMR